MTSKKDMKKITLKDLMAMKAEKEKKQKSFKDIEIDGYGALTFSMPIERDLIDYMEEVSTQDMQKIMDAGDKLIYNNCKLFQEEDFREDFKDEPWKLIKGVLDIGQRGELAKELLEWCGYDTNKEQDKIKNE